MGLRDIYFREDLQQEIVSDLILMINTVVTTNGDIQRLDGAIAPLRARAVRYGIPWEDVVTQVNNELSSTTTLPSGIEIL